MAGQSVEDQPADVERSHGIGAVAGQPCGTERLQPQRHRLTVVQGVVGVHPAEVGHLPPSDEGVVEAVLGLAVVGQWHLVELDVGRDDAACSVVVGELDEQHVDVGVAVAEAPEAAYVGDVERAALAPEPARLLQVGRKNCRIEVGDRLAAGAGHSSCPSSGFSLGTSRNQ